MQVNIRTNKDLMRQIIVNSYDKSYELSIEILDEIIKHHSFELKDNILRMTSKEGWQVSYKYFMDKYNSSFAKIRHSLRKLVAYKLIIKEQISIGRGGSKIILKINFEDIKNFIHI